MRTAVLDKRPENAAREAKAQAFLSFISDGYSVTYAANHAQVGRQTIYDWKEIDADFAAEWAKAREAGKDWAEDKLHEAMLTGNITAIIVRLKMDGRFIDKPGVQITMGGDSDRAESRLTDAQLRKLLDFAAVGVEDQQDARKDAGKSEQPLAPDVPF